MSCPRLATSRLELLPIASSDRDDLFRHLSDAATVEHMDIEPLRDVAGADAIIAWGQRLPAEGGAWWTIRDAAGDFVGTTGVVIGDRERGSRGEVSYNVVRPRWRQGVMVEVLPAVLDHAHGTMGLHRVEALVTPGNLASAGLLERFGFRLEGTLRDYGFWKARFWDQWLYAHLAP